MKNNSTTNWFYLFLLTARRHSGRRFRI